MMPRTHKTDIRMQNRTDRILNQKLIIIQYGLDEGIGINTMVLNSLSINAIGLPLCESSELEQFRCL